MIRRLLAWLSKPTEEALRLPPREDTVGDVLPLLSSAPWQRELLARRLRENWWGGWWWGVVVAGVVAGWGGWLAHAVVTVAKGACP